jgi:transposase-like protein
LLTDTTYFGRGFGVMVFRDYERSKNIYWRYVQHETLEDYLEGVKIIEEQGYKIKAVVCDGKRGLLKSFANIPVQMCQFHQVAIVTRYITKRSKIDAHRALLDVVYLMVRTDKESFVGALNHWHEQWKDYMNEKVFDPQKNKYRYKHHRLRSAYRSLITNLPFLFTWYDHYDLKIPNTTNSLEGVFTDLKNKIRVHAGLKKHRKQKLIDALLSR